MFSFECKFLNYTTCVKLRGFLVGHGIRQMGNCCTPSLVRSYDLCLGEPCSFEFMAFQSFYANFLMVLKQKCFQSPGCGVCPPLAAGNLRLAGASGRPWSCPSDSSASQPPFSSAGPLLLTQGLVAPSPLNSWSASCSSPLFRRHSIENSRSSIGCSQGHRCSERHSRMPFQAKWLFCSVTRVFIWCQSCVK